ncbi:aminoglycoside phosphotransferase family protein [Nonomuraea sp. FMUSA5-5]|uniref:Aminoglycoside phosphotransferase family protein n=1 Tax=Nonomuraea composti TaxID=2720023 RepID=A0ABX1BG07_9ACTN|nr:aminoglycoside phosphotransferase family protein [Nonomuraea sp. FMUSA5-5]NJP95399.1 aminoglycoside phosphotransferase family protein [Nonomuraea sp. FMUSA5-5]
MATPPLDAAAALLGLNADDALLLHLRANAVFHLPNTKVVLRLRHAPGNHHAQNRLRAAILTTRWLAAQGFATIKPLPIEQPVTVNGWIATAWHYVSGPATPAPEAQNLAALLRTLHVVRPPSPAPALQPLGTLRSDLTRHAAVLSDQHRCWLLRRCTEIERAYRDLDRPLGQGLLHGDAHTGNLFRDHDRWVFGDWDSIAYGPLLSDLIPSIMEHHRFGRPRSDWVSFCRRYGVDPDLEHHPAAATLRTARELRSLAAYLRASDQPNVRAELLRRLTSLINGNPATWRAV